MDLKRIYQMLSKLDADEEIGYAYYRQTGKNLDFFDMNRIKLHALPVRRILILAIWNRRRPSIPGLRWRLTSTEPEPTCSTSRTILRRIAM